eukprot:TRINITY_DN51016_c0_g1_i1.p1 TRINITY_DN51016_c0_g1~~TRINITY_DN51016_c0_g1_i1.p1  ORF type:complete len:217 (-),score=49.02 TRINITY_DN51016_c0_g1_i1:94-744(-)
MAFRVVLLPTLLLACVGSSSSPVELRSLRGEKDASPCTDGSHPTCPDGSKPDKTDHTPTCSSGEPTCADGTKPKPPPAKMGKDGCKGGKGGAGSKGGKGGGDRRLQRVAPGSERGGSNDRDGGKKEHREAEHEEDECADAAGPNLAAIIGGTSGVVVCFGIVVAVMCRYRCRQGVANESKSETVKAAVMEPPSTFVVGQPLAGEATPKLAVEGQPV